MKEILIFGTKPIGGEDHFRAAHSIVQGEVSVRYFTMKQMEVQPTKLCGFRPHMVINLAEPTEELRFQQDICVVLKNGQVIDIY